MSAAAERSLLSYYQIREAGLTNVERYPKSKVPCIPG